MKINGGIDLRDFFAAHALQGEMANPSELHTENDEETANYLATWAYQVADAMIREKGKWNTTH